MREAFLGCVRANLEPLGDRLQMIDDGTQVAPGVRVAAAPGHTPGHLVVEVTSDGERLLILGDAVAHPIHLEHPDWHCIARNRVPCRSGGADAPPPPGASRHDARPGAWLSPPSVPKLRSRHAPRRSLELEASRAHTALRQTRGRSSDHPATPFHRSAICFFQHAGALQEPEGLTGGMATAVGVSKPVNGPSNGNDDCGTGFGTGGRAQASQCRRGQLGVRNTNVFGTAGEFYEIRMNTSGYFAPLPCAALALTPNPGTPRPLPRRGESPTAVGEGSLPQNHVPAGEVWRHQCLSFPPLRVGH